MQKNQSQKNRRGLAESLAAFNLHLINEFSLRNFLPRICSGCTSLGDYAGTDLVSTDDASRLLGIGTKTLENWRTAGKGPKFIKLSSRVLYRVADLRAFIDDGLRSSTSERRSVK